MTAIPLYRIDEHHQAFLAWWHSLGSAQSIPRHLVHIDEHADFGLPLLSSALPIVNAKMREAMVFAYRQLTIGTFLIPSNYYGFFNRLSWIRPSDLAQCPPEGFKVERTKFPPWITLEHSELHTASLIYDQADWTLQIEKDRPWLLDICLDAFACERIPRAKELRLSITRQQYETLQAINLDPWRARYGALIQLRETEGHFEFWFQEPEVEWSPNDEASLQSALVRICLMREWLEGLSSEPQVITLARSVGSGYTPPNLAKKLEDSVVEMLESIYPQLRHEVIPHEFS